MCIGSFRAVRTDKSVCATFCSLTDHMVRISVLLYA